MELKRKIDKYLLDWKTTRNSALLVTGARQVGKSFAVDRFGEKNFPNFVKIDFSERTDLLDSLLYAKSSEDLMFRLSVTEGRRLVKGKTLIFFDEIQLLYKKREEMIHKGELEGTSPDLLTLMKKLVADGDYRFILSGSLLGVSLKNILLSPVGSLDTYTMYPLDFEEFLINKGVSDEAISYEKDCFLKESEADKSIDRVFSDAFREYILVGGMPAAAKSYFVNGNLHQIDLALREIYRIYLKDVTSYIDDDADRLRISELYRAIPSELNAKNKRFVASHVIDRKRLRKADLSEDYLWLTNAGLSIPVYNVDEPSIPFYVSANRKSLKLFYNDVGMLNSALFSAGTREKILRREKNVNFGAPYENLAAQELLAHGFGEVLYYFNSKKHGEVDFLIEKDGEAVPIEIKSGKPEQMSSYNHSALNNLIKTYDIRKAYVFGECSFKKESEVIVQMPIHNIAFLEKDEE